MAETIDLTPQAHALARRSLLKRIGTVERVTGLIIESRGPRAHVGDLCRIHLSRSGDSVLCEVVGFRDDRVQMMAMERTEGIGVGSRVTATHRPFRMPVGQAMLGRVVDAWGRPLDGRPAPLVTETRAVTAAPVPPLSRERIATPVATGVRAIDEFLTCGRGQRVGIFSGSGVGKSMLLGMIARNTDSDVSVIALIGERGREVREFIEGSLGEDGLARSVVVVATSNEPAPVRVQAALSAMTLAECFRDQGRHVMFLMDSVTRTAMALREIGLAVGEPPTSRGYTPSVFAFLPSFLERAGHADGGSITAFATVLVEGDDVNDPISDATRGILDGHIVLSRELAARQHFPSIDLLPSVSRVFDRVTTPEHRDAAARLRELLAVHRHYDDLVTVGAYRAGQNRELDRALHFMPRIREILRQPPDQTNRFDETIERLATLSEEIGHWQPEQGEAGDE